MVKKITSSLGSLEKEIMEIIWKAKTLPDQRAGVSVRFVLNKLSKKRAIAYTTIMTTMSRLHAKGILKRHQDASSAYIYTPAEDKPAFLARVSGNMINSLLNNYGDVAVAQFIDILENSDYNTAEWRKKLKKIR